MKLSERSFRESQQRAWQALILPLLLLIPSAASASFSAVLQGQNTNNPTWVGGPLIGWKELDYVPCRVFFKGGPATNVVITINFDHTRGVRVGIENLTGFTPSSNVVITVPPTLIAPQGVDIWTYTFTVTVINSLAGDVEFFARLSAGDHLFPGSSLSMTGTPSLGTLQINKPLKGPGTPDLIVVKKGPAQATHGDIVTYSINYTNKTSVTDPAIGVQLTDVLPDTNLVTYIPGSATNAFLIGNVLTWDLGDIPVGAHGSVFVKVAVNTNAPYGQTFDNFARILSKVVEGLP